MAALNKTFKISVPKSCSENWDKMEAKEKGRFCQSCQKVVIDFSQMTREELVRHFSTTKNISCGRFANHQLDTELFPRKVNEPFWQRLYKPVAACLAFLSMKYAEGNSLTTEVKTIQTTPEFKRDTTIQDKVIISGTVKDGYGNPLENAEVHFDENLICKTDKEGRFQFEQTITDKAKASILIFHYPDLNKVVRSYHPLMKSTTYDVVLDKPNRNFFGGYTMGIAIPNSEIFNFPTITIASDKLTDDTRSILAAVAAKMRSNPEATVKLVGYGNTEKKKSRAKNLLQHLKKYFAENEGIAEERIILEVQIADTGMKNLVDIVGVDGQ